MLVASCVIAEPPPDGVAVMVYLVIADPPFELGAVIVTAALDELIGVAETVVGAPGNTAATAIVTVVEPVGVAPPETVACAVIVKVVDESPAAGVPEIVPVEGSSVSPVGSDGLIEYETPVGVAPESVVEIEVIGVPNVALRDVTEVLTPSGVVNEDDVDADPVPALFLAETTVL